MIQEFAAGLLGVLAGVLLFWLGQRSKAGKERPASPPLTAEQERQNRRALRELANFYTYDGTAQAETDEAALSK